MSKKELKKLAKEIANYEKICQGAAEYAEKEKARQKIIELTEQIYNFEDLLVLDTLIQDYLS